MTICKLIHISCGWEDNESENCFLTSSIDSSNVREKNEAADATEKED